jgi:hypothetical protein
LVYHSINSAGAAMKKLYSDRGAKRGLMMITVFFILWTIWAILYSKELINHPPIQSSQFELVQLNPR